MRSSGSGSNSENGRTGMSLKGKDNQAASEDVLKLAPQVLYIFSQHTLYNAILRIARNFLETRENIKISTHSFYHINLD